MHSLKQVKLIATDMDGTLLNSQHQLPEDFFHILDELHRRNIRFVIASGRPYPTLAMQFESCRDKLVFMAENGACIVDNNQLVHMGNLSDEQVHHLLALSEELSLAWPILSAYHQAYVFDATPASLKKEISIYYKKVQYISNLSDIHEPLCKITVCDPKGAETNSFPILSRLKPPYKATLAGYQWVDLGLSNSNKGTGLAAFQEKYHITPEETMVFGDYLNDCEMMQQGYFSYAMANAHPDLKAVSRFETLSNDDGGVMHVIRQLLAALKE